MTTEADKKPGWENVLVKGRYYRVKYIYNGREFEDGGTFKEWAYGSLYFKSDNGDWIIVKPFYLISATAT